MEFKIENMMRTITSGSLTNVINNATYIFIVSGSGVGSDSGSTYFATSHAQITMPTIASASFIEYASVTEASVLKWVENQYISQSVSIDGPVTASVWPAYTASIEQKLNTELSASILPPQMVGLPWR